MILSNDCKKCLHCDVCSIKEEYENILNEMNVKTNDEFEHSIYCKKFHKEVNDRGYK